MIPGTNSSPAFGIQEARPATLAATMAAYDALPPNLRRIVAYAPIEFSPTELAAILPFTGPENAERGFWQLMTTRFPGWRPLPGDPL